MFIDFDAKNVSEIELSANLRLKPKTDLKLFIKTAL